MGKPVACCQGSLETLPFLSETKLSHHLEAPSYLSLFMMATQASGSSYIYQFSGHILVASQAASHTVLQQALGVT